MGPAKQIERIYFPYLTVSPLIDDIVLSMQNVSPGIEPETWLFTNLHIFIEADSIYLFHVRFHCKWKEFWQDVNVDGSENQIRAFLEADWESLDWDKITSRTNDLEPRRSGTPISWKLS